MAPPHPARLAGRSWVTRGWPLSWRPSTPFWPVTLRHQVGSSPSPSPEESYLRPSVLSLPAMRPVSARSCGLFTAGTKALAADVLHAGQPVFFPTVDARVARWTSLCPGAGVVEFQVNFPSQVPWIDATMLSEVLVCGVKGDVHGSMRDQPKPKPMPKQSPKVGWCVSCLFFAVCAYDLLLGRSLVWTPSSSCCSCCVVNRAGRIE
jgi:hypothetical protein